ncbi:hypothetical protein SDJN03_08911, partial [Cucurbita argyrosperma subsp. sororia]
MKIDILIGHILEFLVFLYIYSAIDEDFRRSVDVVMEAKGGKKKSSSSSCSKSSKRQQYEAPLGYIIEDVRPHGGIQKFRSAAYSNCMRKPS